MKLTPEQVVTALKESSTPELEFILKHVGKELRDRAEASKPIRADITSEEQRLIEIGQPIAAIKSVRDRLSVDLIQARDIVNAYRDTHKITNVYSLGR